MEKDKAFFEKLETGSEQMRIVPIFCNWKNLPTEKTSIFSHKIFTCKVCCQACQFTESQNHRITESQNGRGWKAPLGII